MSTFQYSGIYAKVVDTSLTTLITAPAGYVYSCKNINVANVTDSTISASLYYNGTYALISGVSIEPNTCFIITDPVAVLAAETLDIVASASGLHVIIYLQKFTQ